MLRRQSPRPSFFNTEQTEHFFWKKRSRKAPHDVLSVLIDELIDLLVTLRTHWHPAIALTTY